MNGKRQFLFVLVTLVAKYCDAECLSCQEDEELQNQLQMLPSNYRHLNDTNFNLRKGVLFYLYTRQNPEHPQQLYLDDVEGLRRSNLEARRPTKFMTHGWKNYYLGRNCRTVKRAFLLASDYNVIIIDWSSISTLEYPDSVMRLNMVASYVARFIEYLQDHGSDPKQMTLVGHSLGAQLVGLIGHNFKNRIGHIVGLDPALPMFLNYTPDYGITKYDADLVEIIHTNSGYYGSNVSAGHLDFWPNGGGPAQPGCNRDLDCDHDRAFEYYAESMSSAGEKLIARRCDSFKSFKSGKCSDRPVVRFPSDRVDVPAEMGDFYLLTGSEEEFGLGMIGANPRKNI